MGFAVIKKSCVRSSGILPVVVFDPAVYNKSYGSKRCDHQVKDAAVQGLGRTLSQLLGSFCTNRTLRRSIKVKEKQAGTYYCH